MSRTLALRAALMIAALPLSALAQGAAPATPPQQEVDEDESDIVVTAQRQRGTVVGDIKPEVQLGPADVRALGVSNITELLSELAPQLRSGRGDGQPVVLLEGRRISGFREIANLPAEAISRVDILPEEVALKYGYPADQKVVNIVLRQRFRAFTVELSDKIATGGGTNSPEGEFDFLRIQRGSRLSLHAERESTARLLESQRGIDDATGSGQYRTLLPSEQTSKLNAVLSRTIFGDVAATINGELTTDDSTSLLGRSSAGLSALNRTNGTQTAHAGTTLNGTLAKWRWTFTGNYDHSETKSFVDTLALQADQARSKSDVGAIDFTVNGSPVRLPAGDVSTTVKLGTSFSGFQSSSLRGLNTQLGSVSRDVGDGQISVDLPITSRKFGFLDAIGDLSVNGNFAVRRLSDYGTLKTKGAGVTWSPIGALNLIASITNDEQAPTAQQLGNPVISTPNVRVFDFVRGEAAFVTLTSGGNTSLTPSDRHVFKIGGTLRPISADLSITADYVRTNTTGGINALPPASLASQAAFPGRYSRDSNGFLIGVDSRTVNFAVTDSSEIRWGFNFSKPLKTSQTQVDALRAAFQSRYPNGFPGRGPGGDRGGPGDRGAGAGSRGPGGGGGGGGGRGGFGGGGGRLNLAVYHTFHLTDSVILQPGQPSIDLLRGGTIGSGGQPRHEVEVQAGLSKNGFGARLTGNWQSATRVDGVTPADDLRFSDLATLNFRLFANLGQLPSVIKNAPWLRGARVTLGVSNIFNTRQRVTDATGLTPVNYLPGYLDPLGRTIRISIRKLLV